MINVRSLLWIKLQILKILDSKTTGAGEAVSIVMRLLLRAALFGVLMMLTGMKLNKFPKQKLSTAKLFPT